MYLRIFLLLLVVFFNQSLHAIAGASVKAFGMGLVSVAYPQDSLAAANNPAIGVAIDNRLDLEAFVSYWNGFTTIKNNPLTSGSFQAFERSYLTAAPALGFNYHLNCNLAIGMTIYNRNYQKTTYKNPNPLLGTSQPGSEYINETISPNISYKWGNHNVGMSLNWQIERIKVNGLQNFDNAFFSDFPGHVTNKGYNYAQGVGVTLGWLWEATDTFNLALSWTPKTHMSRMKKYKGFIAQHGRLDVPQKINAGFAWKFNPCLHFAFEYEWEQWSGIKSIHNKIRGSLADFFENKLGSNTGSGFGWTDKHNFRFGVAYAINAWILRMGGGFAGSAVKKSQTALNSLTNDVSQSFASLGATWKVSCHNELSFFLSTRFYRKVKGRNDIPDFEGGGDVALSEIKSAAGLAWSYIF